MKSWLEMSLFLQILFNKMFANSRYLISKLGHIMLMSFNMFNFGTRVACSAQSQIFVRFCCWKSILASSKKSQSLNPPLPNPKNIYFPQILYFQIFYDMYIYPSEPSTMFLSTTDLSYLMLEGSWCPRPWVSGARRCESPCTCPRRGAAYDWVTYLH